MFPLDGFTHVIVDYTNVYYPYRFYVLGKCTTFCLDVLDTAAIKYEWPGVLVIKLS